jgi:hypothetical protein
MSMRYKGGVISATSPTTSQTSASGSWTLEQQMQATAAGNWPRNGPFNWIEDVFSTWLYTGNGSTQTITNGVDLAGKGGLVWTKSRSNVSNNTLIDTVRGGDFALVSNLTNGQGSGYGVTFSSTGYSTASNIASGQNYASWTFRKQPKFFTVITYTGTGSARTVAHDLGSVPGCIIIKRINSTGNWTVWHRGVTSPNANWWLNYGVLQTTAAFNFWGSTNGLSSEPTSTSFSLGSGSSDINESGSTYVAYLFAHNAGGFGTSNADNVISCGSYTTDSSFIGPNVNLGYEPAWVLVKNSSGNGAWSIIDNMRGWTADGNVTLLNPNTSSSEGTTTQFKINATGFQDNGAFAGNATMIYIAIRRGPMKVPTTGTSVYTTFLPTTSGSSIPTGFPADTSIQAFQAGGQTWSPEWTARLTGNQYLVSSSTAAQTSTTISWASNTSIIRSNGSGRVFWNFARAPGFFDVVCFNGVDSGTKSVSHNLQVVPELMITKARNDAISWYVYSAALGVNKWLRLNATDAEASSTGAWGSTPTSTAFTATTTILAGSATNYVAYLFASCPGVSKVGSFTGTGATQVINCGFTGGARFVLIKATSTTGNWLVWDSARGIVAGNDPYLTLNSTAAEVTNTDWVDTAATGFELSNAAGNLANSNGVSYIFLAIA